VKQSKYPTYNASKDGNVFAWIITAAKDVREKRHKEDIERLEANGRREQSEEGQREVDIFR
jgi:hypothetical protein